MMAICKGNRADGSSCTVHVVKDNGYCRHHQGQAVAWQSDVELEETRKEDTMTELAPEPAVSHETDPPIDPRKVAAAKRRKETRAKRSKLGGHAGQRMLAETRDGYHRHWINDTGNNIQEMRDKGYDFVEDRDASIENDDLGSRKSLQVSKIGPPVTAYLMEIPEEFYLEDQADKERSIQGVESQIRRADIGKGIGGSVDGDGESVLYNPSRGKNQLLE